MKHDKDNKLNNMKKYILDFFVDDKGTMSMMRLCTLLLVVSGITIGFVFRDYTLSLGFISLGLGGKSVQKHFELNDKTE